MLLLHQMVHFFVQFAKHKSVRPYFPLNLFCYNTAVYLQGTQSPPQTFVVLVSERCKDGHGILRGLTLWTHVFIDVVGLTLQDAHTAPVVPVLAPVTANVEPGRAEVLT